MPPQMMPPPPPLMPPQMMPPFNDGYAAFASVDGTSVVTGSATSHREHNAGAKIQTAPTVDSFPDDADADANATERTSSATRARNKSVYAGFPLDDTEEQATENKIQSSPSAYGPNFDMIFGPVLQIIIFQDLCHPSRAVEHTLLRAHCLLGAYWALAGACNPYAIPTFMANNDVYGQSRCCRYRGFAGDDTADPAVVTMVDIDEDALVPDNVFEPEPESGGGGGGGGGGGDTAKTARAKKAKSNVKEATAPAWTRGELEPPAGEEDMETWKAATYTTEQQKRLGVDKYGEQQKQQTRRRRKSSSGAREGSSKEEEEEDGDGVNTGPEQPGPVQRREGRQRRWSVGNGPLPAPIQPASDEAVLEVDDVVAVIQYASEDDLLDVDGPAEPEPASEVEARTKMTQEEMVAQLDALEPGEVQAHGDGPKQRYGSREAEMAPADLDNIDAALDAMIEAQFEDNRTMTSTSI